MSEQTMNPQGDIIFEKRGNAGLITLNRPKALNALSHHMVKDLLSTLLAWRDDAQVQVVAIRGSNKTGRPGTPESLFGGYRSAAPVSGASVC